MKRVVPIFLLGFYAIFLKEVITEVVIAPMNVTVSENQAATLTCSLTGTSEAVKYFSWYYGKSSESNAANIGILTSTCNSVVTPINTSLYDYACPSNTQSTWTIKKVTRQNHGDRYQCNIETSSGNENSGFSFVQVQVPVSSVTMTVPSSASVTVNQGTSTEFKCKTSGGLPAATVNWYKDSGTPGDSSDDVEITSNAVTSSSTVNDLIEVTSTLTYSPSKNDNGWRIYCTASNINGQTPTVSQRKPLLNVQLQVNNVILKDGETILVESLYVIGGDSKTLTCTTSFSRPTPTVVWYIGTVERQRSNSNSTFTFIPNNSDNGKQLYCKAFNLQPENEAIVSNKATLNVIDTHLSQDFYIEGHLTQKNVTVDEHDADILFKCIVNSYPQFNIKIVFDGNVLKEQTNESSLLFYRNDVSCFDAGVYTCEGSNIFGRKSIKNITLFVQCPPRPFRNVKRNITSYLYSVVTLGVTVVAYPEPGTKGFAWYKEESIGWFQMLSNADLLITSSGLQSNLTLFNVSKEDYGHYKVIVTNSKGTYEQHIFLSEEMVSDVQEAEGDCSCQTSDKTALIVGLTLGVLCCIVTTYAAYVTISRNKLLREGTKQLRSSSKQVSYANANFASDVTERERYDGDASIQQYTDLTRYTDTDLNTYDVINKM